MWGGGTRGMHAIAKVTNVLALELTEETGSNYFYYLKLD